MKILLKKEYIPPFRGAGGQKNWNYGWAGGKQERNMVRTGATKMGFRGSCFEDMAVNKMHNFATSLKNELSKGLPGTEVQWQMASSDRFVRNFPKMPGKDARIAAVLVLLYPEKGSIHTVFMQRPEYEGVHGGQISFPGGKQEEEDENIVQTALREAYEETGIDPSEVKVIGTLTPLFIPVSNMIVTPVIGWTGKKPLFNHRPEEVVYLIDADIKRLINPSIVRTKPFEIRGEMVEVKYFNYDDNTIWGATAMILQELLAIIKRGGFFLQE